MAKHIVVVTTASVKPSICIHVLENSFLLAFEWGFIPFANCQVANFIHLVKRWQSICCELCEALCLL